MRPIDLGFENPSRLGNSVRKTRAKLQIKIAGQGLPIAGLCCPIAGLGLLIAEGELPACRLGFADCWLGFATCGGRVASY